MPTLHPRRLAARRLVVTTLVLIPLLLLGTDALSDRLWPDWEDYERAVLFSRLRARVAEQPTRPLCLTLGSSRAANAFDAKWLTEAAPHGPLVVNASLVGSTPLTSLLTLRRAVAEGHRPREVILEVLPTNSLNPLITPQGRPDDAKRLRLADWSLLASLHPEHRFALGWHVLEAQVGRTVRHRAEWLAQVCPDFAPRDRVGQRARQESVIDSHGWCPLRFDPVPPEIHQRGFALARETYEPSLRQPIPIQPAFSRVLEAFFAFCAEQQITVRAVLFLPESSAFRRFYGSGIESRLSEPVRTVCERFGVPFRDARTWCPDEVFVDGHHLNTRGSRLFLERLQRELAP
jgi:hypothetical protein